MAPVALSEEMRGQPVSPLAMMAVLLLLSPVIVGLSLALRRARRAEAALREAERFARSTVDTFNSSMAVLDETGTIIAVNRAWREFAGTHGVGIQSVSEGVNYLAVCDAVTGIDSEEAALFAAGIRAVLDGKRQYFALEYPCRAPAEQFWFNGQVMRFQGPGSTRVVVVHENITERKRVEIALRDSEERYRALFENSRDAIFVADAFTGRILDVNKAAEDMLKRPRAELIGLHQTALHPPGEAEKYQAAFASHASGEAACILAEILTGDGQRIPVEISAGLIQMPDGTFALQGFFRDITDRQRAEDALRASEHKFRSIFDSMNEMVVLHELVSDAAGRVVDYRILDCNPAFVQITGIPRERAVGALASQVFGTGEPPYLDSYARVARTGEPTQFETYFVPMRKHFGISVVSPAPGLFATVVTDITNRKMAEITLARERALLQSLIDSIPDLISYKDTQGVYLGCNRAFTACIGHLKTEIMGCTDFELMSADAARFIREQDQLMLASGQSRRNEDWAIYPDGRRVLLETLKTPYYGPVGELLGLIGISRDITARREAEEQQRLAAVAFETSEAIFITDRHGVIERVNQSFARLTGYTAEEMLGHNPRQLQSGRQGAEFYAELWRSLLAEGRWTGEIWNRRKDGEIYPQWESITAVRDGRGEITHFVATFFDLTEQKAAEESLHRLAYYDPLTGLPNRQLLLDRLANVQAIARRDGHHGAVLLVDLDDFKKVNDARSHTVGDRILKETATRLTALLREEDTVAHLGGDEFVVLLVNLASEEEMAARLARAVAEKIRLALAAPFRWAESDYTLGASIGVTLFPKDSEAVDELLKQADTAMYQAKAAGRNAVRFFEAAMQNQVEARFVLEGELRHAIERRELRLYLQRQVDGEGRIIGAEALLRWQHPEWGLVSPAAFIPVAEETGCIIPMGEWVLAEVCRLSARLAAAGCPLRLAVNISPRQFRHSDFVERVTVILAATGADPGHLTLEITEGLVIENLHGTIARMAELKALGIQFSIDDFGTGYSSLAYLKRLPINELKIDKSFVQDVSTDSSNAALVEAILSVARHLSLTVVAEGVETAEQAVFLRTRGCACYQGYLYGRPEPAEPFLGALLSVNSPEPDTVTAP